MRIEQIQLGLRYCMDLGDLRPLGKPLRLWFRAMECVTSRRQGASARALQGLLRLPSYQTAWVWLHKLRRAQALHLQIRDRPCTRAEARAARVIPINNLQRRF